MKHPTDNIPSSTLSPDNGDDVSAALAACYLLARERAQTSREELPIQPTHSQLDNPSITLKNIEPTTSDHD